MFCSQRRACLDHLLEFSVKLGPTAKVRIGAAGGLVVEADDPFVGPAVHVYK